MTNNPLTPLSLLLVVLFASCSGLRAASPDPLRADKTDRLLAAQSGADEVSQVESLIPQLRSQSGSEREKARQGLLALASKSAETRRRVIEELIRIATVPDGATELFASRERFFEWKEATDILGTLKATEAIDTLIHCLECDAGVSGLGPGRYPAAVAIIRIGSQAIPNLERALAERPLGIKFVAAQALYSIGGEQAKTVLENALRREKDKQTADVLKSLLRNWARSGGQLKD